MWIVDNLLNFSVQDGWSLVAGGWVNGVGMVLALRVKYDCL